MSLRHSSTRPPPALKPEDYDHNINIVDTTVSRGLSPGSLISTERASPANSPSRYDSLTPLQPRESLRGKLARRQYAGYQERPAKESMRAKVTAENAEASDVEERGRPVTAGSSRRRGEPTTSIDILYENQRGAFFLCCLPYYKGLPLFSGKALGNLDPSPWENKEHNTSLTTTLNTPCPNPAWEWVWKDWKINRTEYGDDDGWEYSFMFSNRFSWHGPSWWKSFVRRRAWIRKRAMKKLKLDGNAEHILDDDYFTVEPVLQRSRSRASSGHGSTKNRYSMSQLASQNMSEDTILEDIYEMRALIDFLRAARIDRHKLEAVENFIHNGGDELYLLQDRMHDIMAMFIFQASRRLLLAYLLKTLDEVTAEHEKHLKDIQEPDVSESCFLDAKKVEEQKSEPQRKIESLAAAVKHAEEEVRRLEFWSDVRDMADKGETHGAVDEAQGWDGTWIGLDKSAPSDVLAKENLPGWADCPKDEGNGSQIGFGYNREKGKQRGRETSTSPARKWKGKGKAV